MSGGENIEEKRKQVYDLLFLLNKNNNIYILDKGVYHYEYIQRITNIQIRCGR